MSDLLLNQWQPLNDLLPRLRERMAVNDGGKFILENWNCKYVEIRLDMRIGVAYVIPGSGPNLEKTLRLQAEHERDCAIEDVKRLTAEVNRLMGFMPEHDTRESYRCVECGAYHSRQPNAAPGVAPGASIAGVSPSPAPLAPQSPDDVPATTSTTGE